MAIMELLYYPDDRLRRVARPVEEFGGALKTLIADMFETMYADEGIGLAAPQVGVPLRAVVVDVVGERRETDMLALVNPEIVAREGTAGIDEGCLSVPGIKGHVDRAEKITVRARDADGKAVEINADGLLAICLQHELDHLDGRLFIDYLSPLKRNMYRAKAKRLAREREREKPGNGPSR